MKSLQVITNNREYIYGKSKFIQKNIEMDVVDTNQKDVEGRIWSNLDAKSN